MKRKAMINLAAAAGALALLGVHAAAQDQTAYALPLDLKSAEEIALLDAGVASEDADRLHTKQEREDGEEVFEVEFFSESAEYEYTIRQEDGMILQWQIEGRDVTDAVAEQSLTKTKKEEDPHEEVLTAADGTELIGVERAKEIVLQDCGDAQDTTFAKIHFECERRFYEYEFEVYVGRLEYEYKIDAETGEIVHLEMDD